MTNVHRRAREKMRRTGAGNDPMIPAVPPPLRDSYHCYFMLTCAHCCRAPYQALQNRSADNTTGNNGIQDQRMAMLWTKRYIEAFGGDGDDITIFGASVGVAMSVSLINSN